MTEDFMIDLLTDHCYDQEDCSSCSLDPFTNDCDFHSMECDRLKRLVRHLGRIESIRIKYFEPDLEPIGKIAKGDWIDLRAAETVELSPGEHKIIRLGVGMILPRGYEAHVLPRSSTFSRWGILMTNSTGIIDNSYSGDGDEWKFSAYATRETVINKGDRIAQFRIVESQPIIEFEVVDHLNDVSRGGFGSTGER